ncbi:MAG: nucleoside triphosphate pyrophosphohydrolase [Candidatus Dormibacteria bacterium]
MNESLDDIVEVVRRLREPDGCPWDREQTHRSLRPYLLEETYEVLDAIDSGDAVRLREELGDLLLQVVMHAAIAAEQGDFDLSAVSSAEAAKMVKRHPHVFGDAEAGSADQVLTQWERLKAHERGGKGSALDGTPESLPALPRALAVQKRATRLGIEWEAAEPLAAARAALEEFASAGDDRSLGELLFLVVDLARQRKLNPEDALRERTGVFAKRFRRLEDLARESGEEVGSLSPERRAELWSRASG